MMNNLKNYFLLSCIFFTISWVNAQDCSDNLAQAKKAYEKGKLTEIEGILGNCLKNLYNAEKAEAYKLLAFANLYLDKIPEAQKAIEQLLTDEPESIPDLDKDPSEFISLYKTYRTHPVWSIGIKAGMNMTSIASFNYSTLNSDNSNQGKYSTGIGYQFGVGIDLYLSYTMNLKSEIFYTQRSYTYKHDSLFNFTTLKFLEKQNWIEMPFAFSYEFGKAKIGYFKLKPFVIAGGSAALLLSAESEVSRSFIEGTNQVQGPSENVKDLRVPISLNAFGGLGLKYKISGGYLAASLQYNVGISDLVDNTKRYSNNNLLYKYSYVDSNFRTNYISINFGYYFSFYKPVKLKEFITNEAITKKKKK